MVEFIRRVWRNYSKLGKKRKNKRVWRKPRGRDNKMRERRRGVPEVVTIGHKRRNEERKNLVVISNIADLEKISKDDFIVLGRMGKKKKIEVLKKAEEMKLDLKNMNTKNFLKRNKMKVNKKKPSDKEEPANKTETKVQEKVQNKEGKK